VAVTIYASAYLSDVWRGAVEAVPKGQWEGGRALGLGFYRIATLIIAPQAIRLAIAPTVGFMVQIIKGTSLAYIIGFHDLMNIGKRWANAPVHGTEPFIVYPLMALIYFCLCYPLSIWSRRLERRLGSATGSKVLPAG
jgi:polar amino acid transport system permease protein